MDELVLGLVVGSIVALCLGVILRTTGQSRERKKRDPKSKMTTNERRIIVAALFFMAVALVAGVGAFGVL
jgi:membrane protein YqaA with SNARE-associated domain